MNVFFHGYYERWYFERWYFEHLPVDDLLPHFDNKSQILECFNKIQSFLWKGLNSEFPHEGNLKIFQGFGNLNTLQDQKFHHIYRYYSSFQFLLQRSKNLKIFMDLVHFSTFMSKNPQHDRVKPGGGGQGLFTQCVKKHPIW